MNGTPPPPGTPEVDARKVERIAKALDEAYRNADQVPFNPATEKIIVFSDLHKGRGDDADDFRRCEHAFTMALGWYLENGYKLFLLWDVEELWEENPEDVLKHYADVLALESEFRSRGGLERFWGNHDDLWGSNANVQKHLQREEALGGGLKVREALRLEVARPDGPTSTIFFVHGHQGTTASDILGPLSRWPVRHVWRRVQRKTGWSATTPAQNYALRAEHDLAMTLWAQKRRVVLIAGHTHRPVFATSKPEPPPTRPIAKLQKAFDAAPTEAEKGAVRGEKEYSRTANRRPLDVVTVDPPCYFNTGCCSFPDGDITGLELADGQIRLVRWPALFPEICERGVPGIAAERRLLAGASRPIVDVLDAIETAPQTTQPLQVHHVTPG
jgi:hypothetical protein